MKAEKMMKKKKKKNKENQKHKSHTYTHTHANGQRHDWRQRCRHIRTCMYTILNVRFVFAHKNQSETREKGRFIACSKLRECTFFCLIQNALPSSSSKRWWSFSFRMATTTTFCCCSSSSATKRFSCSSAKSNVFGARQKHPEQYYCGIIFSHTNDAPQSTKTQTMQHTKTVEEFCFSPCDERTNGGWWMRSSIYRRFVCAYFRFRFFFHVCTIFSISTRFFNRNFFFVGSPEIKLKQVNEKTLTRK